MKGIIGVLSSERNNFSWQFIQSLINLQNRLRDRADIVYAHSGTIPDGRNFVIEIAKSKGADYVVMIDSDMTFPAFGVDAILEEMEKFDASIGAGIYFGTYYPYPSSPMAYMEKDGKHTELDTWEKTRYITSCGMGFTVIKKDLFDIKFEFRPGKGEDYLFCQEARKLGKNIILVPSVKCGHLRTIEVNEEFIKRNRANPIQN